MIELQDPTEEMAIEEHEKIGRTLIEHFKVQDKKYADFIESFPN